jgi:hypothetical protein
VSVRHTVMKGPLYHEAPSTSLVLRPLLSAYGTPDAAHLPYPALARKP